MHAEAKLTEAQNASKNDAASLVQMQMQASSTLANLAAFKVLLASQQFCSFLLVLHQSLLMN